MNNKKTLFALLILAFALVACADDGGLNYSSLLTSQSAGEMRITKAEPKAVAPGGKVTLIGTGLNEMTDMVVFDGEEINPELTAPAEDSAEDAADDEEKGKEPEDQTKAATTGVTSNTAITKISFLVPEKAEDKGYMVFVKRGDVNSNKVRVTVDSTIEPEAPETPSGDENQNPPDGEGEGTTFTVTSSGVNLTIAPATAQTIAKDAAASFTVTAVAGYMVSQTVGGTCVTGSWVGNVYTTGAVIADCTVEFSAQTGNGTGTTNNGTPLTVQKTGTQGQYSLYTITWNLPADTIQGIMFAPLYAWAVQSPEQIAGFDKTNALNMLVGQDYYTAFYSDAVAYPRKAFELCFGKAPGSSGGTIPTIAKIFRVSTASGSLVVATYDPTSFSSLGYQNISLQKIVLDYKKADGTQGHEETVFVP